MRIGDAAAVLSPGENFAETARQIRLRSPFVHTLICGDTNGLSDIFVHDRQSGHTERLSLSGSGNEGDGSSEKAAISGDGRFVAFMSFATDLVDAHP